MAYSPVGDRHIKKCRVIQTNNVWIHIIWEYNRRKELVLRYSFSILWQCIYFCHTWVEYSSLLVLDYWIVWCALGFPGGARGKELACQCGLDVKDVGLIPGSGTSRGEASGHPLQHSCLGNPMDRGAWQATVHASHRIGHKWNHLACTHTHKICFICIM